MKSKEMILIHFISCDEGHMMLMEKLPINNPFVRAMENTDFVGMSWNFPKVFINCFVDRVDHDVGCVDFIQWSVKVCS